MANQVIEGDRLFFIAESLAKEFSSFPDTDLEQKPAPGLLSQREVNQLNDNIASLDIDAYVEQVIAPAEAQGRKSAPEIVRQLGRMLEKKAAARITKPFWKWTSAGAKAVKLALLRRIERLSLAAGCPSIT